MNLRAFAYLQAESTLMDTTPVTFPADHNKWCKDCDDCITITEKLKVNRCGGKEDMVWKTTMSDGEIYKMSEGDHVMGHIDYLGWAVLKSFVESDKDAITDVWKEKCDLKNDFENDIKKTLDKRGSTDIQTNKDMQFKELVRKDPNEFPFFSGKGSRYMKYPTIAEKNPSLKKHYPRLDNMFDRNTKVCSKYLRTTTHIRADFVSASRIFLVCHIMYL